ncbi:MAG: YraN family protein [Defluviitaleaceae bacterium]|nr:YraN family protein [Defluviitaleaceae bacterium]
MANNREKGYAGERLAEKYLVSEGYQILARNFRYRQGEIDIVASKGGAVVFVEVKYRDSLRKGYPAEAVTAAKQRKIRGCAEYYIYIKNLANADLRFDVIQIIGGGGEPVIDHIENAF